MAKDNKELAKEANLRSLYTELNKFGQNGEYEKALKTVNRILGIAADEERAIQCKVVCLLQVSKFQEAIQFIDKMKITSMVFERSYCEYRLNQPEKALKSIDSSGLNPLPDNLKELRAQVLYRLERFEECFDAYRDIIKNTADDYENERATNLSAAAVNLAIEESRKDIPTLGEDTYELCYNAGCRLAGEKKYAEAEKKLRLSEKMCRDFLEEDGATEEDIQEELAIIKVQLAYCIHMQGRGKEAANIYGDILKNKPNDAALVAVCSNNIVTINKDQNVFDSKKKIRAAMADACEHKLTNRQKKVIAINNCLVTLYTNQADQCHQLCKKLVQTYPDTEFEALLIRVSQLYRDKKIKEAVDILEKFAKENPSKALATNFANVQILLMGGNKKGAIEVLQSLGEDKYLPGIVSALVSLLIGIDDKKTASQILKDSVAWYKKNKVASTDLTDMWRQAATFHLRGGEPELAASSLEELLKTNPKDMKILAQLVIAYAQFNTAKAQDASKGLPTMSALTNKSDIDNLEAANWMMSTTKAVRKNLNKGEQSPGTPGSELGQKKKRPNRKRKGKMPKVWYPDVLPDPERWLPKYERTGYRRKRDKRTKEVMKGSQGTQSGAAEQYDMSRMQNMTKASPVTPVIQETAPGPRQQQRKHQQKKKKGRH